MRRRRSTRSTTGDDATGPGSSPTSSGSRPTRWRWRRVLNQAFPTWAVVGVRSVAELDECVGAADLALDPGQVRWLASGDGGGG